MVAYLFAQGVYTKELLADCLRIVGYGALADSIVQVWRGLQKLRGQTRLATGFNPASVSIPPKRFTEITTWKGKVDREFSPVLKDAFTKCLLELGAGAPD